MCARSVSSVSIVDWICCRSSAGSALNSSGDSTFSPRAGAKVKPSGVRRSTMPLAAPFCCRALKASACCLRKLSSIAPRWVWYSSLSKTAGSAAFRSSTRSCMASRKAGACPAGSGMALGRRGSAKLFT